MQRRQVGPSRIGEGNVPESDLAGRLCRQGHGIGGRSDRRLLRQDLGQPLGRAGRLRQLAPDFRQRAERARGKHRIDQELA